jgi:hypothetical protein
LHAGGYGDARGIVMSTVDSFARRQTLHRGFHAASSRGQSAFGLDRPDVRVDNKSHAVLRDSCACEKSTPEFKANTVPTEGAPLCSRLSAIDCRLNPVSAQPAGDEFPV